MISNILKCIIYHSGVSKCFVPKILMNTNWSKMLYIIILEIILVLQTILKSVIRYSHVPLRHINQDANNESMNSVFDFIIYIYLHTHIYICRIPIFVARCNCRMGLTWLTSTKIKKNPLKHTDDTVNNFTLLWLKLEYSRITEMIKDSCW